MAVVFLGIWLVGCGAPATPETTDPGFSRTPSRSYSTAPPKLISRARAIQARGKQIAAYSQATVAASSALSAQGPNPDFFNTYLAVENKLSWDVFFGKLTPEEDDYSIGYAFKCTEGTCVPGLPHEDTKSLAPLALAVRTAAGAFTPVAESYNTCVFAEKNGTISVYLTPGNRNADVALHGGDFRISVDSAGTEVIKVIRLHETIMEFPSRIPEGATMYGTIRTNISGNLPNGTDVAFIIQNPHLAPQVIIGKTWTSRISRSGDITVLGKTSEILDEDGNLTR